MGLMNQDQIAAVQNYHQQQPLQRPHQDQDGFYPAKLYVGNLSLEVTDVGLKEFFEDCGIPAPSIHRVFLKKGFAFVEFVDKATADLVVKLCNGKPYMNTLVRVEHSNQEQEKGGGRFVPIPRRPRSKLQQILFSNCSPELSVAEVRSLIIESGAIVVSIEAVRSESPGTASFVARIPNMKFAIIATNKLNQRIVSGSRINVRIMAEEFLDGAAGDPVHPPIDPYIPRNSEFPRPSGGGYFDVPDEFEERYDIPLRIMVPNEFIGAIIGRGGATIRAISKGTGARLDIFRHFNRNYDMPDKPVSITGAPNSVTQACKKILEIVAQEVDHQRDHRGGDIALKMFVPNSVVGRIIGRSGAVIKQIMDDTQTKIHISNQPDCLEDHSGHRRSNQRLITIRGSIDGMSQAESIVSEKLQEAVIEGKVKDADLDFGQIFNYPVNRMMNPPDQYFNSGHNTGGNESSNYPYDNSNLSIGGLRGGFPSSLNSSKEGISLSRPETAYIYVPEESVGALIGKKGSSIRQIIHASGASIKVLEGVLNIYDFPSRRVVIHGGIESIFFAQYLIYQKVVDEGKSPAVQVDEPQLTVEMSVPTEVVGRLIGKAGTNIREIQRQHFCHIKFLTESDPTSPFQVEGETFCRITGTSHSFLMAQKRIRSLLIKAMNRAFSWSNDEGNGSRNECPAEEERPIHSTSLQPDLDVSMKNSS